VYWGEKNPQASELARLEAMRLAVGNRREFLSEKKTDVKKMKTEFPKQWRQKIEVKKTPGRDDPTDHKGLKILEPPPA